MCDRRSPRTTATAGFSRGLTTFDTLTSQRLLRVLRLRTQRVERTKELRRVLCREGASQPRLVANAKLGEHTTGLLAFARR